MANIRFQHSTHDTLKQIYVKKKTFRWLLFFQITTLILLGLSCYKLNSYGYFNPLFTEIMKAKDAITKKHF